MIHSRDCRRRHGADPGRGNGEGCLPRGAALLHRRPRSGVQGHRARPLRVVHRHPDVQEAPTSCARSPRRCRPTASWSKPTRPISRRCRIAASATSRPMWWRPPRCWRRRAASRSTRSRGRPRRISSACSTRCRATWLTAQWPRMSLTFTILGCGSSMGVPRVALGWGACDPNNPKNRRRRCSLLVDTREGRGGVTRVLVDCTPDLREQLLDAKVDWVDGVLFTHEHADHTHGIDDLRPLFVKNRRRVDVYMDEPTAQVMRIRFRLLLREPARQRLSADRQRASADSRPGCEHQRAGRRDRGPPGAAAAWRHRLARLPLRQCRLFRRHQEPARGKPAGHGRARRLDRGRAAPAARIRAT